jgi:hypothetical protein
MENARSTEMNRGSPEESLGGVTRLRSRRCRDRESLRELPSARDSTSSWICGQVSTRIRAGTIGEGLCRATDSDLLQGSWIHVGFAFFLVFGSMSVFALDRLVLPRHPFLLHRRTSGQGSRDHVKGVATRELVRED